MNALPQTHASGLRHRTSIVASLRTAAMAALFGCAAVVEATQLSSLSAIANADIWWHLRAGLWIAQNHAVPHAGIFSQSASLPWSDSSWAYDLILAAAYKFFGFAPSRFF